MSIDTERVARREAAGLKHSPRASGFSKLPLDSTERALVQHDKRFGAFYRRRDPDTDAPCQPYADQEECDRDFAHELAERACASRDQIVTILRASWAAHCSDAMPENWAEIIAEEAMEQVRGQAGPAWEKPVVMTKMRDHDAVVSECTEILKCAQAAEPRIYAVGNLASERVSVQAEGGPKVVTQPLRPSRAKVLISEHAHALGFEARGRAAGLVPSVNADVASALCDHPEPWPPLECVTRLPYFLSDGTLWTQPGYNPGARTYLDPDPCIDVGPIPLRPTEAQVREARATIHGPFR